jgi:hypothetical protein
VPAFAAVAFGIVGFCCVDVKPSGPVHEYAAPAIVEAVSVIVPPAATGLFEEAAGDVGTGLTTTSVVPGAEGTPPTVAVTE